MKLSTNINKIHEKSHPEFARNINRNIKKVFVQINWSMNVYRAITQLHSWVAHKIVKFRITFHYLNLIDLKNKHEISRFSTIKRIIKKQSINDMFDALFILLIKSSIIINSLIG